MTLGQNLTSPLLRGVPINVPAEDKRTVRDLAYDLERFLKHRRYIQFRIHSVNKHPSGKLQVSWDCSVDDSHDAERVTERLRGLIGEFEWETLKQGYGS